MSGIYIHIPICKSKCSYCDFYSVVSLHNKHDLIKTIFREIEEKKNYLPDNYIDTIYFGGGTPSLLSVNEIISLIDRINTYFIINSNAEITLECNPDDLHNEYLKQLKSNTPVNRLSIGIQSFCDQNLKFLHRRHNAENSIQALLSAKENGFENISIDLIYGIPASDLSQWEEDLKKAIEFDVQHISAYHLSYEKGTLLYKQLKSKTAQQLPEEESVQQYRSLINILNDKDFIHYEISNFAREGFYSRHNMKYWTNQGYTGIGPSAHSYNLESRQWNIPDINLYIRNINNGEKYYKTENLTISKKYNDYILTGLRTAWGVSTEVIDNYFGKRYLDFFLRNIRKQELY